MALNFTVSYTFAPSTTISSSQVNTNTSDVANVFTGLEAETKTLAKLKVDADPTIALEVATKQYVDHYSTWRRPVLQYNSGSVVNIEKSLDGTSGDATILFPDGSVRTDSTTSRINCTMSQTAAFSGSAQSGIDTGSVSANTWYSFYAAKVTDSTANFVATASLLIPAQANYSTLNTRFGTNGWVYLGCLPYGDNSGTTTAIPSFVMSGNLTSFRNAVTSTVRSGRGVRLASTASATSLTWSYASGTALGSNQVPAHLVIGSFIAELADNSGDSQVLDSGTAISAWESKTTANNLLAPIPNWPLSLGLKIVPNATCALHISLAAYTDGVLGVGSNPQL